MPSATTIASEPDRVEVVTSVQRRRRWSLNEKLRAVEEASAPGMTVSYIARKHGIHPSPYSNGGD
jgi:transposase